MNSADHIDTAALNMLVAWQKEDPVMRSFNIRSRRNDDGETEWAVHVHSKRWRCPPEGELEERRFWHCAPSLYQAIGIALEAVFRHKGAA